MKRFTSKMSKVASLGLYFAFIAVNGASRYEQKDLERPLAAGRKSEGLNSATYEIVELGYMKKTRGEIEWQDHGAGFSVRWFFAAGILGLDIAAAEAMRIYRTRFPGGRAVHD